MANLLQIKRSASTGTPTGLANGELAFSSVSNALFIGSPSGSVVAIGGARNPGILTANQALVANSTSGIDEIRVTTANIVSIFANGSLGTAGQVLTVNSSAGLYWSTAGVDTSASYTWTGLHEFRANLHVGNTTVNSQYSNANIKLANATTTTTVNLTDIRVGNTTTNVIISNTVSSFGGNVSITGVANVTGNVTLGSSGFFVGNGVYLTTVNATSVNTGTLPWAQAPTNTVNTTGSFTFTGLETFQANIHIGSSTVNSQFSNANILLANATATVTVGLSDIRIGNTTTNSQISNASIVLANATTTTAIGLADIRIGNTTTNVIISNTGSIFNANVHVGNTTVNTQFSNSVITINNGNTFLVNASSIAVGNSTSNVVANVSGFFVNGSAIYANASTLSTGTISAGLLPSSVVNTSGNFTIGGSSTLSGNNNFTGAQTYFTTNVIIGSTNTNISGYLAAATGYFSGGVTIAGDLIVNGTTTSINTTSLMVKDNVIQLADQLASTTTFLDNVDIGLYIQTGNSGAGAINYYSGLARIAATSTNTNPYFKLFSTQTVPGATTIDTGATTGTLQAFLAPWGAGGGFVVNSTAINITANSTVSSTLTANTLTLTTGLAGTSGGTGKKTMTSQAILVGNSTNGYDELALGADTYFLQSNGTALVYSANLDGGSF